ncbi:MAG: hypothetical protein Q7J31_13725 [Syntrophales bacterium]|nr:hypothetical protein [Syntrophales bacterium]
MTHASLCFNGDAETKGETHEGELYRLFMRVGEMISAMLERRPEQGESFGLYVLTDHGACYILDSEKQAFESKIVSKLFADEKRRFAMIGKEGADTAPENLWALGYRFVPPFIKGENVFFIPRGHSTVRAGGAGKGYTHGGATPQEVIVQVADEEFVEYCVNPAVRMRQQIRDELARLDQEYQWVTIKSERPDVFQLSHPEEKPESD